MTFPPQQPGPYGPPEGGGYGQQPGQQPGQNPPTDGYPQQPGGYPQTPGYLQQPAGYPQGAPGGYPQTGGFPPQPGYPPGQPGQPGQPGGFGQQPGGFPPGYPTGQGPQKSKTPFILAGVGVAVVLLVVFVGGFAWPGFFTGGSTSSPTDLANTLVSAIKSGDGTSLEGVLCTKPTADQIKQLQAKPPYPVTSARLVGTPSVSGNTATAQIQVTVNRDGKAVSNTSPPFKMLNQNGKWCLDNSSMFGSGDGSSGSSTPPSTPQMPSNFPSVATGGPSSAGGFGDSGAPGAPPDIPSTLPGDGSGSGG